MTNTSTQLPMPTPFPPEVRADQMRLYLHEALTMLRRRRPYQDAMIVATNQRINAGTKLDDIVWLYTPEKQSVLTIAEASKALHSPRHIAKLLDFRRDRPNSLITALYRHGKLALREYGYANVLAHQSAALGLEHQAVDGVATSAPPADVPKPSGATLDRRADERAGEVFLMPRVTLETLRRLSAVADHRGELTRLTVELVESGTAAEDVLWLHTPTCALVFERSFVGVFLPRPLASQLQQIPYVDGHLVAAYVGLEKLVWEHVACPAVRKRARVPRDWEPANT